MSYFSSYQYIQYQFPDNKNRFFKNLSTRMILRDSVIKDLTNFTPYYVKDNETPEIISFNTYGSVDYHWCIMLVNNVISVYNDWPRSTYSLEEYLVEKYKNQKSVTDSEVELSDIDTKELIYFTGSPSNNYEDSDGKYGVLFRPHHFEDADKNYYSFDTAFGDTKNAFGYFYTRPVLTPISIFTYEFELNEAKRDILLPNSKLIEQMEKELKKITNE